MGVVTFNVGLLFEPSVSRDVVDYSQRLHALEPADYFLGENSLPHLTVLQFEEDLSQAEAIWERLAGVSPKRLEVTLRGLMIEQWRDWLTVGIRARSSAALVKLQDDVRDRLGAYDYVNGLGTWLYEPHLTLVAWPRLDWVPRLPIGATDLHGRTLEGQFSLGVSGPLYQYAKRLR